MKKPIDVELVRHLSQSEGYFDDEIAALLHCHRVTVTRVRNRHHIPRPNLKNRKDKEQVCKRCSKTTYLRRKERIRKYCEACQKVRDDERREKKRLYMREREK